MVSASFLHSVQFRLSTAIAALFLVILLVSVIGVSMLRSAEGWLDRVHTDTLSEVSRALELSSGASNLATSAPFLITVQIPAMIENEAQSILQTIAHIEKIAADDQVFVLPLARMRAAVLDMNKVSLPKRQNEQQLVRIDRDLLRLQNRFKRLADQQQSSLKDRLYWAHLQQLTAEALGAARAQQMISVGEYRRQYDQLRQNLPLPHTAALAEGVRDLDATIRNAGTPLFLLRHQVLTSELDAENALFRIRQASNQLTRYSEQKVSEAEERLRLAQAQTTQNLVFAQRAVLVLALASSVIAIAAALYTSRHVAKNLRRISNAMRQLASGDLQTQLPEVRKSKDEIGQLFEAFSVFRSNAKKLERHTNLINRQNALFANVFRNINDGVAILSSEGRIEAENDNVRAFLRLPKSNNLRHDCLYDLIEASEFRKQLTDTSAIGFDEYADPSGNILEVRRSSLPDGGSVWLFSETTERRKIGERLEEIRRVESLGKLTGEVAHDFGNILSTISGNVHLLEMTGRSRYPEHLRRIAAAVDLGVTLTERLLAFARKQHLEPEVVEVGALVEGMIDLLDVALSDQIELSLDIRDPCLEAKVDPGQLESAILNLCMNAGQAISGKGYVSITVAEGDGEVITVEICDTGCGMSPDTLRRASEPFFTNRSDGAGTGLGLSMVHGFVHQSGGTMDIESSLGLGTTIRLRFPIFEGASEDARQYRANGVALVVDDDQVSAEAAKKVLSSFGFETQMVLTFAEASDAITQLKPIRLIVTDLQLDQGKSGWSLVRSALTVDERCRAILMSSKLPDIPDLDEPLLHRFEMIEKPVTPAIVQSTLERWKFI
ncbi:MAG: ATP-binding protein [Labrenzia sp.]